VKKTKTPYDLFCRNIRGIEELYEISSWAYKNSKLLPGNHRWNEDKQGQKELELIDNDRLVSRYKNHGHFRSGLRESCPSMLRAVLYVRAISVLEVYLIDSVKYSFARNPQAFQSQKKHLQISHNQLLSSKSISSLRWEIAEKETRNLHSSGFKEVVKFYKNQLNVDMAELGIRLGDLEKFHDRRHLLVHRLGKIDSQYRHKYNDNSKLVKISGQEFEDLLTTARDTALIIDGELESLLDDSQTVESYIGAIRFSLREVPLPQHLQPNYCFVHEDRYLRNSDFFRMEKVDDSGNDYVMHIRCHRSDLPLIRKVLKRLERREIIVDVDWEALPEVQQRPKLSNLPFNELVEIASSLPRREHWFQGIHRELAYVLGISNNQARRIISSILDDEQIFASLGTDLNPRYRAHDSE
jgi:hypothetical protein